MLSKTALANSGLLILALTPKNTATLTLSGIAKIQSSQKFSETVNASISKCLPEKYTRKNSETKSAQPYTSWTRYMAFSNTSTPLFLIHLVWAITPPVYWPSGCVYWQWPPILWNAAVNSKRPSLGYNTLKPQDNDDLLIVIWRNLRYVY